jgi:hypothetical protein
MMNNETLGKYNKRASECEYLTLVFSPSSVPLRARWRNNGLSADFLGDYVITFLPAESRGKGVAAHHKAISHAVTYIANELLENAMKYHERNADIPIGIHLELTGAHITVSVSNGVGAGQAERYKAFVEHLLAGDAHALLLQQQEDSAKNDDSTASCVGLLTMISDYDAQLGWRFDAHPAQSELMTVTTKAVVSLQELEGGVAA